MAHSRQVQTPKDADVSTAAKEAEERKIWAAENAEAIRDWTAWAEHNELPLAKRRSF